MGAIIALGIIIAVAVSIIAFVVVYQFIQQQTALNKLESTLNPESKRDTLLNPEPERGTLFEQLYDSYQECIDDWNKPQNMEILKNNSPTSTPKEHCDVMSGM